MQSLDLSIRFSEYTAHISGYVYSTYQVGLESTLSLGSIILMIKIRCRLGSPTTLENSTVGLLSLYRSIIIEPASVLTVHCLCNLVSAQYWCHIQIFEILLWVEHCDGHILTVMRIGYTRFLLLGPQTKRTAWKQGHFFATSCLNSESTK